MILFDFFFNSYIEKYWKTKLFVFRCSYPFTKFLFFWVAEIQTKFISILYPFCRRYPFIYLFLYCSRYIKGKIEYIRTGRQRLFFFYLFYFHHKKKTRPFPVCVRYFTRTLKQTICSIAQLKSLLINCRHTYNCLCYICYVHSKYLFI